ncbi:MAG: alpha/beta hydrolase [Pseudomonas sp.]|uniref:alpha/beta hydrolase n=1 Tax=Pseudomonas sp. TaxID=306 RepID=UPI001A1F2BB0|nr:alpha/beta hydrolase [Pseudomonas sp.]MBJ7370148.1 alpha/beta hydrolase [Pseudomonas sp.]
MANGSATAEAPPPPMAKRDPVSHTLTCKTDQSVKQVTVSIRDATVFLVGGAGDQERYYVDGPNHNVDYVRDMVDADIEALEIQKSCTTLPLGYNSFMSEEDLERNVIRKIPSCNTAIYIIGHSLGGWNGAHLSAVLTERGFKIKILVTLDPVGHGKIVYGISKIYRQVPKPKAQYWVNIRAAAVDWNLSDLVADFGEQWEISEGPNVMGRLDINHADANSMYAHALPGGKSARQIVAESIFKWIKG